MLQNLEAEMTVLGMALIDKQAAEKLCALPEDLFSYPETTAVFQGIKRVIEKRGTPDLVTVLSACHELGSDPRQVIIEANNRAITAANYGQYETILLDLRKRRNLASSCADLAAHISDESEDADILAGKVLEVIRDTGGKPDSVSVEDALIGLMSRLEKKVDDSLSTGISGLDRIISGFRPKQFVVLGARPGVGKTALAIDIASNIGQKSGPVLFVSLEMDSQEIMARIVAQETGIDVQTIDTCRMEEKDWLNFAQAASLPSRLKMRFTETAKTPMQIRREAQAMIRNGGLKMIVVDYLQLMRADRKCNSRYEEISDISRELKLLAMDLGVTVLALTQFNRESEAKSGMKKRKPSMSEAKDSGSIEQDANIFLTLYPPEEPKENTTYHEFWDMCKMTGTEWQVLTIEKNRQGRTGAISLQFDKAHMRFTTLEPLEETNR